MDAELQRFDLPQFLPPHNKEEEEEQATDTDIMLYTVGAVQRYLHIRLTAEQMEAVMGDASLYWQLERAKRRWKREGFREDGA